MFKMIGALCVFGSCGYLGLRIGHIYKIRTELLRSLQNGLNLLETEISYSSTPLPFALERVGKHLPGESSFLFQKAARVLLIDKGATASEAWEEGIKALEREVPLREEEITILTLFGKGLGSSAKEEQMKNIALSREQLRMVEKTAWEEREKNQKLWQYMGFCLGTVIILIFI